MKDKIEIVENFAFKLIGFVFLGVILPFMFYIMFIWFPVHLINESECLEKGYPETTTTIMLVGYCKNIDGTVTGVVEKL